MSSYKSIIETCQLKEGDYFKNFFGELFRCLGQQAGRVLAKKQFFKNAPIVHFEGNEKVKVKGDKNA